ncbi:MAG: hypothetical protein ACR2LV_12220 [Solirubrobacteraceae bacterium]
MRRLVATILLALSAFAAVRRRRRRPARAVIVSPRKSTVVAQDGGVRSVQSVQLTLARSDLARLWNATNLENLGRTYWRSLSRMTLGLARVVYGQDERSVVLLCRPLTLLRFGVPAYVLETDHGNVRWQIRDGLLVARAGRGSGYLAIDVRRHSPSAQGDRAALGSQSMATLQIEVEVANFYPSIATGFSMPVYEATQSSIHVLVTHAFLRSLAKLDLAESKVGRLALGSPAAAQRAPWRHRRTRRA